MNIRVDQAALCVLVAVIGGCGDAGARYKVKDFCEANPDSRICDGGPQSGDPDLLPEFYKLVTGVWKSACTVSREYPPAFSTDTLRFEDKSVFKRTYELFSDKDCKTRLMEFSDTGSTTVQKKAATASYSVVFTMEKSTLTPSSEEGASILKDSEACKKTDWVALRQQDLASCAYVFHADQADEESFSLAGLEWFEFVTVKSDQIFLSKKIKAELYLPKSDFAPTASDDLFPYRKQ